MKVFVVLIRYTEQGVEALKEAPRRAQKFTEYLTGKGVSNVTIYWTFGAYDGVVTFHSPDDETAHRAIMTLSHMGNVRTETLRGYEQAGFESLLTEMV